MYQSKAAQLNTSLKGGFCRRPYTLFKKTIDGKNLTRVENIIFSAISSFSGEDARCKLSYSGFSERYNVSRASVARTIRKGKAAGLIEQDKSNRACASYRMAENDMTGGYIITEDYLYHVLFSVCGQARKLTRATVDVLSLIKTHCDNKNGDGCFTGSVRSIMTILHLSKRTVQQALKLLLNADLIFRPHKGINNRSKSEFHINKTFFRKFENAMRKKPAANGKPASEVRTPRFVAEADARADRERFYAQRRSQAEAKVKPFRIALDTDPIYHNLEAQRRPLSFLIAKADVAGDAAQSKELTAKEQDLTKRMLQRMKELGISPEDLQPPYRCKLCNDTGTRPDGFRCTCYPLR